MWPFKKDNWKSGQKDVWEFARQNGRWLWRRYVNGDLDCVSSKTFTKKAWAYAHASALGYKGKSKAFEWSIVGIKDKGKVLYHWEVYNPKDTSVVFQRSKDSWETREKCVANAERYGYGKN